MSCFLAAWTLIRVVNKVSHLLLDNAADKLEDDDHVGRVSEEAIDVHVA